MELYKYAHKKVRIVLDNNAIMEGIAKDYINAQDNLPEIASISIGNTEILESEILSIEEIVD